MKQIELVEEAIQDEFRFELTRGYAVYLPRGPRRPGDLYHNGHFIKRVNLSDKLRHEVACASCFHLIGGNHPCHRVNLGV
jgi:hypothetical protein